MRFALTPDQELLRETVRVLLERTCTAADLREAAASATGRSPERWGHLAEMGVVGLTAPAAHGGLGLDERDLVLVLEEAGRVALPEPLVEHTAVALPILRDAGHPELARASAGDAVVTAGLQAGALVPDAHVADLLVLASGDEIHVVPRDAVRAAPRASLDGTRRLFELEWEPVPATVVATGAEARAAAFDRGALATAAVLCGLADRMIALAAAYAQERHQFGRPIGSFQAVKHHLADALLALEFARPAVYRAAWSVARAERERARDVSMAKALASDAALVAARTALQVHGAIGYTEEADLHLYAKRAWALAPAWGDAAWHRARVAAAILA